MSSVHHNCSSQPHVLSNPVSSHRSLQQPYSARTPGEGYPFPRLTKPRSNTITLVEKNASPVASPKSTPSAQISPNIDMDVFKQLLAMEDDTESSPFSFTKGLIDLYYEDSSRTVEQMRSTLQIPDYIALGGLAHFLRGSVSTHERVEIKNYTLPADPSRLLLQAASVGISQVAKICESIEMRIMSKPGALSNDWFESQIQDIEETHRISRKWFREFFNKHGCS